MKLSPEGHDHWYTPLLYNLGIRAYSSAVAIAALRNPKCSKMRKGQAETWSILSEKIRTGARYIWFHTASLGEFEQGRPLIERLRREKPELSIILTFFSPSGYEVRKNYNGADIVCYLPFDTPAHARRFINIVKPEMAIFVKYEFWRNYLLELSRHAIPTYLISGIFRPSQLFFRRGGKWYRRLLRQFTRLYVQDQDSSHLLADAAITAVTVAGDTRFDRVTDIMAARRDIPEIESFTNGKFVFMAGSSWPSDEEIYFPWLDAHPEVTAVIAPHEFNETRLRKLIDRFPEQAVTLSDITAHPSNATGKRILIIDCFGLLSSAYRYATIAYIGGGFGAGLHNINEAAVYGIPVIFGPNNRKFIEAREIQKAGGGFEVTNQQNFDSKATPLLTDATLRSAAGSAAGNYIKSKLGATEIIYTDLFE